MAGSLITLPLRVSLRTARTALRTTRDVADLGLVALELAGRALGAEERDHPRADPPPARDPRRPSPGERPAGANGSGPPPAVRPVPTPVPEPPPEPPPVARPVVVPETSPPAPAAPAHVSEEPELVAEVSEPGAEDGAGAAIRVVAPFDGYDALRAADVVSRVGASDPAELAAIALYESTHRGRRTVLAAVTRAQRRRGAD